MKRNIFYICFFLIGLGFMVGCSAKKAIMASFSDLYGEWTVVEIKGKLLSPDRKCPVLNLDVARLELSGFTSCNQLMGKIEYAEGHKNIIRFLDIATTRRACPDMSIEQEFVEALRKVVRFQSVSETDPFSEIALYGANNTKLLVIKKQK